LFMAFEPKLLGERIKENLKHQNISQEKLAELLGKSVPMISYYESGKSIPSAEIVFNLSQYFHVSSDYLLR